MRLGGEGPSGNFEDRTGSGGGFGGGGGNMLGCLLPLVMSRFGIIGVVILLLGYCALQSLGGGGSLLPGGGGGTTAPATQGESRLTAEQRRVLVGTLASTEQVWGRIFEAAGVTYQPANMIAYTRGTQSGCGAAQAAMGPFYCPTDQSIYIDPAFFDELTRRFKAPGDFAQIYVVAHEVGHHIQGLQGRLGGGSNNNQQQVAIELQADCYAGVWAKQSGGLEAGDIEEGMRAAEAIGDDTLQQQSQGVVVPESFTHGTSAQRVAALRTGLQSGDPAACKFS